MKLCVLLLFGILAGSLSSAFGQWRFQGDKATPWQDVIAGYQRLDELHTGAKLMTMGEDDAGLPIHLFVIADGSGFHPDSIRASGKAVLWVTNGIHPGEPDGVDASLLLAQALLESDQFMGLTANVAVCIVPVYNVWGARRSDHPSRPDQNGPPVHGVRANSRNLDLNRDFMKGEAANTRHLRTALAEWDPDVYFETHVSDGADHRYVMELLTTQKDKLNGGLALFLSEHMEPALYAWMDRKGLAMCPYFETVKEIPEDGLYAFYDSPRYSTGYNALFDRIGILAESHMLKPYEDRVNATLQLMLATMAVMNEQTRVLLQGRARAKANTASVEEVAMNWVLDTTRVDRLPWKGYEASYPLSEVSGLPRLKYDHTKPTDVAVPWMQHYRPTLIKEKPLGYLIPRQWSGIAEQLRSQGVEVETVATAKRFTVEEDSVTSFTTGRSPTEGHFVHRTITTASARTVRNAEPGDLLVRMGRHTDRLVMEALEPQAEDGFFAWGAFDAVLQQKEWFTPYVFEDIAADLLRNDPLLGSALEAERQRDPEFAQDAWAQLYFVFQRSPYRDRAFRIVPIRRIVGE